MHRPARFVLVTLAATLATGVALVTPSSTAGTHADPDCDQNPELVITSRQYMGSTFSIVRAYTRYCDNRLDRAINDMTQVAGSPWSVNYIASRCERDMFNRMDPYLNYIEGLTEDIMLNHYDHCPTLFGMNLAFNNACPGILSNRLANFRDQLDGAVATYANGDSFDDTSINPGNRGGTFGGGGIDR